MKDKNFDSKGFADFFTDIIGIDIDKPKKPHPQQKTINEISNILKKYGSK